jgi:hypothetical protein
LAKGDTWTPECDTTIFAVRKAITEACGPFSFSMRLGMKVLSFHEERERTKKKKRVLNGKQCKVL